MKNIYEGRTQNTKGTGLSKLRRCSKEINTEGTVNKEEGKRRIETISLDSETKGVKQKHREGDC